VSISFIMSYLKNFHEKIFSGIQQSKIPPGILRFSKMSSDILESLDPGVTSPAGCVNRDDKS